jgi:hypothetical protein
VKQNPTSQKQNQPPQEDSIGGGDLISVNAVGVTEGATN